MNWRTLLRNHINKARIEIKNNGRDLTQDEFEIEVNKICASMRKHVKGENKMADKQIDQYIKDYELGNLEISKGGNFQDFLNRLIQYYQKHKEE